jgi:hypothetical protein
VPAVSGKNLSKPLTGLMGAVIVALTVSIIASSLSIVFDIHRIAVVDQIEADVAVRNVAAFPMDQASAHASDHQTAVSAIVELVALLAAASTFLAWFYRAYANLPRLGIQHLRHRPGWAIGSWFVPVLSLVRPKQIANDIWRGSDPTSPDRQPDWHEPVSPLLHWWWALFLLNGFLGQASLRLWNASHSISRLRSATDVDIASSAVSIIAAGLAGWVVYRLSDRQTQRIESVALASGPAGVVAGWK